MRSDDVVSQSGLPIVAPPPPPPAPTDPVVLSNSSPFTVAAIRAVLTALLVGATTFLATWSTTNNSKELIIATGTAVVGVLFSRLAAEGIIDQARADHAKAALLRRTP